ncbi:CHRD domain-containing protein [Gramella sp. GC03-9]|uniref:CHRD domain-containing protein n=1 Tax=Christiangramia oceanisediminis TaxID=2920386 RepID=A0A9X2KXK4_9FLAO|nr:CHRD domain-containing protein [Gramella oceanisediminis]MCP9200133.1 CHRD domain-containing protein [Gramella oceanisediminis]
MKNLFQMLLMAMPFLIMSCSSDDDLPVDEGDDFMGEVTTFDLSSTMNSSVSGTATFTENEDGSTTVELDLDGTTSGMHPAHIHYNSAAEGGDIAISLDPVDGSSGMSTTTFSALDDGTSITYMEAIEFDGYINVHLSADDLATLIAQGDIGENDLTGESKSYTLESRDVDGIMGSVMFEERMNGEALATIMLDNTPDGGMHPAHIHMNTAAEGGDIAFTFNPVNGDSGMSMTNVAALDDGSMFGYDAVLDYDGYVNVHLSSDDLGTLVAQGDIGQNELTGESKTYELESKDVEGIMGTATFEERVNGEALATLMLENTPEDGIHPAHIHMNTAIEGGDIAFTFNPVMGDSGMSMTNVAELNDGTMFGYDDLLNYDGYINVHLSADDLGTLVAQGDIGQNELTGETKTYDLGSKDVDGIMGSVVFEERINGEALATIMLDNTPDGGMHPAHIHMNTAAEGGDIAFTFNMVNGSTGMSMTNVASLDDGSLFGYEEVLDYDGYVNVHLSADQLGVIVAQGDIGQNDLTGESATYDLGSVDIDGIMGTAMFEERVNGETLVTLSIQNTPVDGMHPAHIHMGSVAEAPGDIAITLNSVMGETGMSLTNVSEFNAAEGEEAEMVDFQTLTMYDGYINVHLSAEQLDVLVAQGNIGSNE